MRHFDFLAPDERAQLFLHEPQYFDTSAEPELLGLALGATLYSPATRPTLAADIVRRARQGVVSMVVCLEDAIADAEVAAGERNAIAQLRAHAETGLQAPLLFVRVRSPEQIPIVIDGLGEHADVLTGFVLPKFTEESGVGYLDAIVTTSERIGAPPARHARARVPRHRLPGVSHPVPARDPRVAGQVPRLRIGNPARRHRPVIALCPAPFARPSPSMTCVWSPMSSPTS